MPRGRRKYQPLAAYLAGLPSDVSDVTLTLAEIEAILGEPLPAGAVTDAWWGIASSPQGRGWLDAGWWVRRRAPRSPAATITFGRVDPAMPRPGPPKYEPLRAYLAAQPPDVTEVTLTFPELEAV